MKTYIYEAKTLEEAVNKALTELNISEDNLIIKLTYFRNFTVIFL